MIEQEAPILVVDDDPDIRETLRLVLESWGRAVKTAGHGREALERMAEERPALVLLDLMMPVMSGAELLLEMQNDPELVDIPVVLVTAWPKQASALTCEVISKPIDLDHLRRTVERR